MYIVNVNKLKGRMVELGLSMSDVAAKMGINQTTLYRKFANDGAGLSISDAQQLVEILQLTAEEAIAIFFTKVVA